jgi:redox-sensitive bicupin YhaK (pirin superfamily)
MIIVRKSKERRYVDEKDQKTWMTFDPKNNTDPHQSHFGVLNVLNEEILSPGGGFVLHAEKDMIVVTYVRDGGIVYKAPLEQPGTIESKEFQHARVLNSSKQYAFNTSESEDAHVFQCGIELGGCAEPPCAPPSTKPNTSKKLFTHAERQGVLRLIASEDGKDSSLALEQDVQIYSTYVDSGNHISHALVKKRSAWLHVVNGRISLNGLDLSTGDGAGLTDETNVSFLAERPSEILLFDLCESKDELKERKDLSETNA